MSKTSSIFVRIEPKIKDNAERIFSKLGISASSAINMFYQQVIYHNGLPFEVKLPSDFKVVDSSVLSEEELMEEIKKGHDDVINKRTRPLDKVIEELNKEFNI